MSGKNCKYVRILFDDILAGTHGNECCILQNEIDFWDGGLTEKICDRKSYEDCPFYLSKDEMLYQKFYKPVYKEYGEKFAKEFRM
jgi:hypothetical protein